MKLTKFDYEMLKEMTVLKCTIGEQLLEQYASPILKATIMAELVMAQNLRDKLEKLINEK